jgi:Putative RNA methylase family UPF0020/HEAT repeats
VSGDLNTEALIQRLGDQDPKRADAAGVALIDRGSAALPLLLGAFPVSEAAIRRRIVFVIGQVLGSAGTSAGDIESTLEAALDDEDWKVRKNAAVVLGKVGRRSAFHRIAERLQLEDDSRIRVSLMLALGKLAGPEDIHSLEGVELRTAEEAAAARKVLDRLRGLVGSVGAIDAHNPVSQSVSLELWCRSGVAEVVSEEARERNLNARVLAPDRVGIHPPEALENLLEIRSALYPVLVFEADAKEGDPQALGRAFSNSPVAVEIKRLTLEETPRYRVTLLRSISERILKRDWIGEFALECEGLVNAPTGYSWELIVRTAKKKILLGARPAALRDERFSYRVADIAASLHPTLAAAAVRLCPAGASDIILDPFCGSGTLLAERALKGGYRLLIGADIDNEAILAARRNLEHFQRVVLMRADATKLGIRGPVDVIISNPPYGQRVANTGRARRLHAALDSLAMVLLRAGGWLVVFRPTSLPHPAGFQVSQTLRVDAGGIPVNLIVARKR